MSQTYTDDCYSLGMQATTSLQAFKDNFAALKSAFSGVTAPGNTVAGMWWYDTTAHILRVRNEDNTAWLSVWDLANNKPVMANIVPADFAAAMKDAAAGTASLRTLGTGATQAMPGNATVVPASAIAGDYFIIGADTQRNKGGTAKTKIKEIIMPRPGTFRIKFDLSRVSGTMSGQIYRNGDAVGTQRDKSSGNPTEYTTYSEDISGWTTGDLCQLYCWCNNAASSGWVKNFRIYEGNVYCRAHVVLD